MSTPAQINTELDDKIKNTPLTKIRGGVLNTILKMITGSYYNKDTDSILFKLIFTTTRVYKKDEAAIYGNTLYVANEDNITGAWNAAKWTSYLDLNPGAAFAISKYASGTRYLIGNYTEYQNEIYRAKTEVQGITPDPTQETAQWVKIPHKFKTCDEWRAGLYLDGSVIKKDGKLYEVTIPGTYFESAVFATDLGVGKFTQLGAQAISDIEGLQAVLDALDSPKFSELESPGTEGSIDYAANSTTGDLYVHPFTATDDISFAGTNIAEGYSVFLAVTVPDGLTIGLDPSFELVRGTLSQPDGQPEVYYLKLYRYPTDSGGDLKAEVIEEAEAQAPVNSSPIDSVSTDFELDNTDPEDVILKLSAAVKASLAKADSALQEIADESITGEKIVPKSLDFSRIADISTARMLGRIDPATGIIQQLTNTQVLEFLGVKLPQNITITTGIDQVIDNSDQVTYTYSGADNISIAITATKLPENAECVWLISGAGNIGFTNGTGISQVKKSAGLFVAGTSGTTDVRPVVTKNIEGVLYVL